MSHQQLHAVIGVVVMDGRQIGDLLRHVVLLGEILFQLSGGASVFMRRGENVIF